MWFLWLGKYTKALCKFNNSNQKNGLAHTLKKVYKEVKIRVL